jgi:hypothetical protein
MQARYMDPATGRLVSEDPGRDGRNWYCYCNNSPIFRSDPSGKEPADNWIMLILNYVCCVMGWDNGWVAGSLAEAAEILQRLRDFRTAILAAMSGSEAQVLPAITEACGPSGELDMSGASNALGEVGAGQGLAAEAVGAVASEELAEAIELLGQDAWYSYPGYPPL